MLTPLNADESVDETSLRQLVDFLVGAGVHGIWAMGTTGEFAGLPEGERARAVAATVDQVGGQVVRNEPAHGKTSWIRHDNSGVMAGVSDPFEATRYHSLIVEKSSVPAQLVVTAWTADGTVMGLRHARHPTYGVQFHPESVLTKEGKKIIGNFVRRAERVAV